MPARRGVMPLLTLQWQAWAIVAIVLALVVTAGLALLASIA